MEVVGEEGLDVLAQREASKRAGRRLVAVRPRPSPRFSAQNRGDEATGIRRGGGGHAGSHVRAGRNAGTTRESCSNTLSASSSAASRSSSRRSSSMLPAGVIVETMR